MSCTSFQTQLIHIMNCSKLLIEILYIYILVIVIMTRDFWHKFYWLKHAQVLSVKRISKGNSKRILHIFRHSTNDKSGFQKHDCSGKYKCSICTHTYTRKDVLQRHTKEVHSQSKQFKCDIDACASEFPSKAQLTQHKNGKHNLVFYPCTKCGRVFGWPQNLSRHEKNCS